MGTGFSLAAVLVVLIAGFVLIAALIAALILLAILVAILVVFILVIHRRSSQICTHGMAATIV